MKAIHVCEPIVFHKNNFENLKAKYSSLNEENFETLKPRIYSDYMKDKFILFLDIDKTICESKTKNYIHSIPNHRVIHKLNKLYDDGHEIHFWNIRGISEGIDWNDMTQRQLKIWNAKYSSLNFGNPCIENKEYKSDENKKIIYIHAIEDENDYIFDTLCSN